MKNELILQFLNTLRYLKDKTIAKEKSLTLLLENHLPNESSNWQIGETILAKQVVA